MNDDLSPDPTSNIPSDPPETSGADAPEPDAQSETPEAEAPKPAKKKRASKKKRTSKKKTSAKAKKDEPAPEAGAEPEPTPEPTGESASELAAEAPTDPDEQPGEETEASDAEPVKKKSRSRRKKTASKKAAPKAEAETGADEPSSGGDARMLINYDPGGECRVAIVENGRLEEFFSESTTQVSRVNNIYVGKVTNVEPAIQAAFVDFGVEDNGFLHVSDLHPQYFPGENADTTERVGKKIPRRSRPPIQECLKRGQEVVVQVLKEGVGTKGPTLTSYLSIPGRYIVMMPDMDRVGVSRKEEDDEKRREAKEVLNSLELPEGFGFILRTAGMGRTKIELKRDLAYLQRLWKDMVKRRRAGRRPRLLYSESDLLVRSIRDLLTAEVTSVTIDHEPAVRRAASFLKIVAPRTQAKLIQYTGKAPIYHAFGIQDQIETIHSREVPLPSGGRLVIDEAEALVAIDVNSGKSRSARDAETNAYRTNLEAVDEICRQLRLRDLGGLVVNDLIDMRFASHRKEIENRFKDRFRHDRARTTVLPISQFGILELTRQRMRGSQESLHFSACTSCRGRGLLQRPESVAARALRQLTDVLDRDKIARVELVVSPRVAGALLSQSRAAMTRLELSSGKQMDVRVSETLPPDRVTIYAYDESGADIDVEKMPKRRKKPEVIEWHDMDLSKEDDTWAADMKQEAEEAASVQATAELAIARAEEDGVEFEFLSDDDDEAPTKKKRRRRRGRRRRKGADEGESENEGAERSDRNATDERERSGEGNAQEDVHDRDNDNADERAESESGEPGEDAPRKKRRRRRGGRRRSRSGENAEGEGSSNERAEGSGDDRPEAQQDDSPRVEAGEAESPTDGESEGASTGKKRRRRRSRKKAGDSGDNGVAPESDAGSGAASDAPDKKRTTKKSSSTKKTSTKSEVEAEPKAPPRGLYARGRRKLSASELSNISKDD